MNKIVYSLVKTKKELKEAANLVCREYVKAGYIDISDLNSKKKILFYNHLPSSTIFTAKLHNKIIGTVSVIADSKLGLPMDEIYKKELDKLRNQNKKIAEISQLAADKETFLKKCNSEGQIKQMFLFLPLFKLVFHYSIYKKFNNLCIAVNPKHSSFYKYLLFKDIGKLKHYPSVNNAPALAKTLYLDELETRKIKNYIFNNIIDNAPDYKIFENKFR